MKATTVLAATLLTMATASPTRGGWEKEHEGDKDYHWKWNNDNKDMGKYEEKKVFHFDAIYNVIATPEQVVNNSDVATGGLKGAIGYYNYGINTYLDTICYNITLVGVYGAYQSAAKTATHIHQAAKGKAGPPRIAIPNPVATGEKIDGKEVRRASGCLTAPFVTGINATGTTTDTGSASGFKLSQIVANPAGFFTDVHVAAAVPGAVRAQLA